MEVKNPCPVRLKSLKKQKEGLYCKGCKNHVVDFRGLSDEEILASFKPNTCGLFTVDQLPEQKQYPLWKAVRFRALVLASFLGFTVSPMKAQTTVTPEKKSEMECRIEDNQQEEKTKVKQTRFTRKKKRAQKRRRRRLKRSKVPYRVIGCPDF